MSQMTADEEEAVQQELEELVRLTVRVYPLLTTSQRSSRTSSNPKLQY